MNKPRDVIEFLGRHLICIGVTYRPKAGQSGESSNFTAFAGCLIDIRGLICILTAGHIVRELERLYSEEEIIRCVIADTFGPVIKDIHPVPFDFISSDRNYIDDDGLGLDFGLIFLPAYCVRLIAKHEIVPLDENAWRVGSGITPNHHFVLGFPEELTRSSLRDGEDGAVAPTLVRLEKLSSEEFSETTTYPRFVAKVNQNPLSTMRGLSGGPIFAFSSEKLDRYWIVAIQSSWLPSKRIVFGCDLSVMGSILYKWADEVLVTCH